MNKKIVITGATKGIGRAVAIKFAAEGFDLALCARSDKDLKALKAKIGKPKSNILIQKCDVSDKEQLKSFADTINKEFGPVDILINNAGAFIPGEVINEKDGVLESLIETNLYSAYRISRAIVPGMLKRKKGHIFNLCSVASIGAYPNGGSYSISKFALLGLSKALREELKQFNIKVTAIIAGAIYTDSWKGSGLPASRFIKAEDAAKVIWDIYNLSQNTDVEELLIRPQLGDI
jgi:short-subunit dehydrogenase